MDGRLVLLGLVVAQLADAATFRVAVEAVGIGAEANPFAHMLFDTGGADAVVGMKGIIVASYAVLLAALAERFPRLLVFGGATATSAGLLGVATNLVALIRSGAALG